MNLIPMQDGAVKIAVLGDLHLQFDQADVEYFNASGYDLLLFVGDLGELFHPRLAMQIAGSLSHITKPALLIPGNHDTHNFWQLIAEVAGWRWLAAFSSLLHPRYHRSLCVKLLPVVAGGYSVHHFPFDRFPLDVVCARPFAMGGSRLNFAPSLRKMFAVRTIEDSISLICQQVDATRSENVIFLAHNGPHGLSPHPTDIWGCDFEPQLGDFGDHDLTAAISYAQSRSKRVLAVIAGHMHLQTYLGPKPIWQRRGTPGPRRPWHVEKDGVHYVNAAQVPRIVSTKAKTRRHHISLQIEADSILVDEIWVDA